MEAFIESVATTPYGPILGKIERYIGKRLGDYDAFIRGRSEKLGILARESGEAGEAAIQECFGRLEAGLKGRMQNWAQRIAGALVTPRALSYSGPGQHVGFQDTPRSLTLISVFEDEIDTYLKIELERLYDKRKEKKGSYKAKFRRADEEITKWFEGSKKEVKEGEELVGLFKSWEGVWSTRPDLRMEILRLMTKFRRAKAMGRREILSIVDGD